MFLWDIDQPRPTFVDLGGFSEEATAVAELAFSADGNHLWTALGSSTKDDEAIVVWDLRARPPRPVFGSAMAGSWLIERFRPDDRAALFAWGDASPASMRMTLTISGRLWRTA
ncbi:hypothetical protein [Sphingobium sp. MK2]|uniref:hypothetical protein n=1 Tax=Sphingobium sp. MK2 TaxID=3116540 RepID=UPI0032E3661E